MARRNTRRWTPPAALSLPPEARPGPYVEVVPAEPVVAWIQTATTLRQVEARVIWRCAGALLVEWGFGQAADCAWVWQEAVERPKRTSRSGA